MKSSTLDDPEGHWQQVQSAILATAGLLFPSVISWLQLPIQPLKFYHYNSKNIMFGDWPKIE